MPGRNSSFQLSVLSSMTPCRPVYMHFYSLHNQPPQSFYFMQVTFALKWGRKKKGYFQLSTNGLISNVQVATLKIFCPEVVKGENCVT